MKKYFLIVVLFLFESLGYLAPVDGSTCGVLLSGMGIWAHGQPSASVANPFSRVDIPSIGIDYHHLFEITVLGGGFDHKVKGASFSPDSSWIAAVLSDGTLGLWNLRERKRIVVGIPDHVIYGCEFSPNSRDIMVRCSGERQNKVQVLNLQTRNPVSDLMNTQETYRSSGYANDGRYLLVVGDKTTGIIDAESFRDTKLSFPNHIQDDDDGKYMLGFGRAGTARIFDLETGLELASLDFNEDADVRGSVSAKNGIVVLEVRNREDKGVPILRDVNTLRPSSLALDASEIEPDADRISAELSPGGNWVYSVYYSRKNNAQPPRRSIGVFWDTRTGRQVLRIPNAIVHPRYNEDETFGAVEVIERGMTTPKRNFTVVFNSRGETVAMLPGRRVRFFGAVIVTQDGPDSFSPGHYHFKDLMTGAYAVLDSNGHALEFSPDGNRFYYLAHGAIHLVEVNPEVVEAIERARRRSASPD